MKAVLGRFGRFQCTSSGTVVYAVWGPLRVVYGIVPDYSASRTFLDVLVDALGGILKVDKNIEILCFVDNLIGKRLVCDMVIR